MNKSKAKGTRAETRVVNYLATFGIAAERRALSGNKDNGDIKVILKSGKEITLEIKTGKQTTNPSRSQIEEWLAQTNVESKNAGCDGVLIVVRHRRQLKDADVYALTPNGTLFMYLDEFALITSEL